MKKVSAYCPDSDLFGDVIVTADDVDLWLDSVPKLSPTSPRRENYIRQWDVVNKIKAAKLGGWFDELTAARDAALREADLHRLGRVLRLG